MMRNYTARIRDYTSRFFKSADQEEYNSWMGGEALFHLRQHTATVQSYTSFKSALASLRGNGPIMSLDIYYEGSAAYLNNKGGIAQF